MYKQNIYKRKTLIYITKIHWIAHTVKMQYYLHTLLLEQQKIFHYLSPHKNEKQITEDCQNDYELVKTNPPIIFLACIRIMQTQDIDNVIKNEYYYYPCFDIHYGHHQNDENNDNMDVSNSRTSSDEFENELLRLTPLVSTRVTSEIIEYYLYIENMTRINTNTIQLHTELAEEHNKLKKYLIEKRKYEKHGFFYMNGERQTFDRKLLECCQLRPYDIISGVYIRYEDCMQIFKTITQYFYELEKERYNIDENETPMFFFTNPEKVFDIIFFDKTQNAENVLNRTYELAVDLMSSFEYMCTKIINYLDEYIYDLSTYSEDKMNIKIWYLERMLATPNSFDYI